MMLSRSPNGYCPACPRLSFSYDTKTPQVRTCGSCGFVYLYIEENAMPVCSVCDVGFSSCACYLNKAKLPLVGQIVKVTQKLEGGITKILQGPVVSYSIRPLNGGPGAMTLGDRAGNTEAISIAKGGRMLEDATWEIILPPEPPNKSVWVCPESNDRGKLAIWRRLDHLAGASGGAGWFYPGSVNGATWEQVYNTGAGYLLEPKNG